MAIFDILKPKSEAEIKDLLDRGFLNNEHSRWKFQIRIAKLLDQYRNKKHSELFKNELIKILEKCEADVMLYISKNEGPILSTENKISSYKHIIEKLKLLPKNPYLSEIDKILVLLYDFGDNNNIYIEVE